MFVIMIVFMIISIFFVLHLMAGLLVIPFELDVVVLHIICSNVLLDIFLTFIRELLDLRERNVSEE